MSGSVPAPVIAQDRWGICGFVSVLNALHEAGPLVRFGQGLSIDQIHERLAVDLPAQRRPHARVAERHLLPSDLEVLAPDA